MNIEREVAFHEQAFPEEVWRCACGALTRDDYDDVRVNVLNALKTRATECVDLALKYYEY